MKFILTDLKRQKSKNPYLFTLLNVQASLHGQTFYNLVIPLKKQQGSLEKWQLQDRPRKAQAEWGSPYNSKRKERREFRNKEDTLKGQEAHSKTK